MSNLVALHSPEGEQLLADVRRGDGLFQPLLFHLFKKQIGDQNCGIQSCAMVLGAQQVGTQQPDIKQGDEVQRMECKYEEMSLLTMPETQSVVTPELIKECSGLDLNAVYGILRAHHVEVAIHHASDITEDEFRVQAKHILKQSNSSAGIIVNYYMATLGQSFTYGHHSPLAGYHEKTDRFLLMDVWKENEECWAKTSDLYKAMNTTDDASGKTRGFVAIY
ncbi:hypothetical protein LSH36_337g05008 [Paralvinella palmiformis]|uniref:glutathione gamma-glutamylcysteinyltransferase n=1 Tax=Paralvinella palmiformis TaxID=53620 RepID=A0AAD9JFJ9_9ANNE|nr:hypothetical protein LSH36_337g05008 [Paralvinella palmiformis]